MFLPVRELKAGQISSTTSSSGALNPADPSRQSQQLKGGVYWGEKTGAVSRGKDSQGGGSGDCCVEGSGEIRKLKAFVFFSRVGLFFLSLGGVFLI